MEAENYLASGFATKQSIETRRSGWSRFASVAHIWQPSRLKGITVSPEYGTPFLAATQVYDFRPIPRKWLSLEQTSDNAGRFADEGTILLTCSGSVGRATLADKSLAHTLISHDLLRIKPMEEENWGWVYAYLRAPTIRAMMTSAQYGHMIKHLEISHLEFLPYIHAPAGRELEFTQLAREIISSRNRANELIRLSEERYAKEIGPIPDFSNGEEGFSVSATGAFGNARRLDGNYHNPVARAADAAVASAGRKIELLSTLVEKVFVPGRFKHVYGPEGLPYLDSAQILEVAPDVEKYVLSLEGEKRAGYLVEAGTLLLPCSGQLHGVIGNVVLAGKWHENKVLTNHILRIIPKQSASIRIGYLQAVLSHPKLGRPRVLRGAYGSSVPELSVRDIESLKVPRLSYDAETFIADAMEEASTLSAHANTLEDEISTKAEEVVRHFLSVKIR